MPSSELQAFYKDDQPRQRLTGWREVLPQIDSLVKRYEREDPLVQRRIIQRLDLHDDLGSLLLERHEAERELTDWCNLRIQNPSLVDDGESEWIFRAVRARAQAANTNLVENLGATLDTERTLLWNNTPSAPYLEPLEPKAW